MGSKREDLRRVLPFILCLSALAVPRRCRCCLSRNPISLSLPGPVHRSDRCTRGIIVVEKTDRATTALSQYFADRYVSKSYVALVFYPDGDSDSNIGLSL